ncbi:MAG: TetR/AcrR family transcriptional regulator [Chlorobiaceae bacterium]|nr:TetR/AcrR family transcriptional regulator [Chlorobiaceae bacterium]
MGEKKEDRRVGRTRRLMQEALMALVEEKGYERITVQDILDWADVGRSTFYAHFRDKDELLLSWFEHLRTLFEQQQQALLTARRTGNAPEVNIVLDLFRYTGKHHKLYKAISGRESGEMIRKYLHRYLSGLLQPVLEGLRVSRRTLPVPVEVTTHQLVSSLLSLMTWWLDHNMPYPPEKMEEMFRILTRPSIEAALGKGAARPKEEAAVNPKGNDDSATSFYNLFIDPFCCPGR